VEQDGAFPFAAGSRWALHWHETLEAAKTQANFGFGVEESDWKEGDDAGTD
jgi:hypothetical protein